MRRWSYSLCFCLLMPLLVTADDEFRQWTDVSGKFKIEAKLVERSEVSVVLENRSGKRFNIQVSKLSKGDVEFLEKEQADNPFQEMTEQPAAKPKDAAPSRKPAASSNSSSPRSSSTWIDPVDWSMVEEKTIIASDTWAIPVDESNSGIADQESAEKKVPLLKKQHFFEGMQPLAVNPAVQRVAVGYTTSFSLPKPVTRIALADLKTGKAISGEAISAHMRPLALLHDGSSIVMAGIDEKGESPEQLQVWRLKGKQIERGPLWTPYEADTQESSADAFGRQQKKSGKVSFAESVAVDQLLTCSESGHLALWDLAAKKPLWHMHIEGAPTPAFSVDRSFMAFAQTNQIVFLRVKDGEVIGLISTQDKGHLPWISLAFSPTGKSLAVAAGERLLMLDLKSKEWTHDIQLTGLFGANGVMFPHEEFVMLGNRYLIHWPSRIRVWDYQDAASIVTVGGTVYMGLNGDAGGLVLPAKLPHPQAIKMLEAARASADIFVVRPGVGLKLDVSGVPAPHQAEAQTGLTNAITKIGCRVQPNAEVEVVASVSGPKQEAVSYIMAGSHVVQRYTSKVAIRVGGQEVWASQGTNIPGILMLSNGETIEQHLAKASSAPNTAFFGQVVLPEYLQKPAPAPVGNNPNQTQQQMTLGVSKLTINGLNQ